MIDLDNPTDEEVEAILTIADRSFTVLKGRNDDPDYHYKLAVQSYLGQILGAYKYDNYHSESVRIRSADHSTLVAAVRDLDRLRKFDDLL